MVRSFGKLLLGACFALAASAAGTGASAHFNVLYRFKSPDDGRSASALIIDKAGNFYGTTPSGGSADKGAVFRLAPDGTKTTLYDFADADSGAVPLASLLRDKQGNLYGTTQFNNVSGDNGGTVFKVSPDGHETVLHRFNVNDPAGYMPRAELIADKSGYLYGTTTDGNGFCDCGAVFKLAPNGTMTVLHAFTGGSDGLQPQGGLVADKKGNLYGATAYGGLYPNGGTVFRIATDGAKNTLHNFNIAFDGATPWGSLIIGKDGNLYGTAFDGGPTGEGGVVFKMAPDGTETVLYNFGTGFRDGDHPMGALVMDRKGNLYGTTSEDGWGSGCGTVFSIAPDGSEKTLRWFSTLVARHVYPRVSSARDGFCPLTGLARDAGGTLYGTTSEGGNIKTGAGLGTIFAIEK